MNQCKGIITAISTKDSLSLVTLQTASVSLSILIVETPDTAPYLRTGNEMNLMFKETEVIIAKGNKPKISIPNQIEGTVVNIEKGKVVTKVAIDTAIGALTAIITTMALEQLQVKSGDNITAMIKTTEIMLAP